MDYRPRSGQIETRKRAVSLWISYTPSQIQSPFPGPPCMGVKRSIWVADAYTWAKKQRFPYSKETCRIAHPTTPCSAVCSTHCSDMTANIQLDLVCRDVKYMPQRRWNKTWFGQTFEAECLSRNYSEDKGCSRRSRPPSISLSPTHFSVTKWVNTLPYIYWSKCAEGSINCTAKGMILQFLH